jgi:beta-galactosidase GanA
VIVLNYVVVNMLLKRLITRYLGIVIDFDLKWKLHIEHVYRKLVKFTSIFFKLRQKLTDRVLKLIYFAFVHSYILYGVEIYANTCCTYLDKLFKLNNKLLRILQSKSRSTTVNELYRNYETSFYNHTMI